MSLARLVEAHTDAVAILAEAGRRPVEGSLYGVWASESPQHPLVLEANRLNGSKAFCSGGPIVDRALVTVRDPDELLLDIDLRRHATRIRIDATAWAVEAFADTATATVHFDHVPIDTADIVGPPGWYLARLGFWHGACGPAACWAGGAETLWDYCLAHPRDNPQDLANVAAIYSQTWASQAALDRAGQEIDADPHNRCHAQQRALALRSIIDHSCAGVLRRFAHVYGPRALAFDRDIARHYQELQLYIRQSHAERDLEVLGRALMECR